MWIGPAMPASDGSGTIRYFAGDESEVPEGWIVHPVWGLPWLLKV